MLTRMIIDAREPQTTTGDIAVLLQGNVTTGQQIKYGDLWWGTDEGTYGVELKSVSDALHSMWSREQGERLERQLGGLREYVDVPILGIHGIMMPIGNKTGLYGEPKPMRGDSFSIKLHAETRISPEMVDGFLWSVAHPQDGSSPINVIWRPTKQALLRSIVEIYHWSDKVQHGTFVTPLRGASSANPSLDILMAIKGLGFKRAKALIEMFGTPAKVFTLLMAEEDKELMKAEGIGKSTVEMMRKVICGTS